MKNIFLITTCLVIALSACNNHFDSEGNIRAENLTSSYGSIRFTPMLRSDSASVFAYTPDTFYYKNKPYTGNVATYNQQQKILMKGALHNGLQHGEWKFYYATGGIRMQGYYNMGLDTGIWQSYYGYNKPRITKWYDEYGFLLQRIEYFDNGKMKSYQNIKHPAFGNKKRKMLWSGNGKRLDFIYVEDSILQRSSGDKTTKVGEDLYMD